jgi:hypothetical protein
MPQHLWAFFALTESVSPETSFPYYHAVKWLIALAGTIIAAAIAVIFDNIVKRLRDVRGHNLAQLLHEILAEHQIAYLIYFVALLTGAEFLPAYWWARDMIGVLTFLAFGFYLIAVYLTSLHEVQLQKDHHCQGRACTKPVSVLGFLRLSWLTSLFTLLMLATSVALAFMTV